MRRLVFVLAAIFLVTAAFAGDANLTTLTLVKAGDCSGTITAVDRATRQTIASCGFGCTEKSAQVAVGTRISITTQAYGQCSGGIDFTSTPIVAGRRGMTGIFPVNEFRIKESGAVIKARFRMASGAGTTIPSSFR
jgi:hypothetical protein